MYESFFGFSHRPFAAAPRIDRYFPGTAIEAARQSLARAIERADGAGIIVGPAGTGKTLTCHLMAEQFRGRFAVALLSNGHLDTRRELLQAILFELGLPYRRLEEGELRLSLIDYIAGDQHARDGLLLLVDEAHTLSPRLLEEIRLIANVVRHGQSRVRLVLAGSPGLEETLADPQLEALNQRIATRCYLDGFDHSQTQQYVVSQLAAVGTEAQHVFTSDALEAVYRATDGIPRLINQVCDHALMLAFAGGRRQIHGGGIEEAWSDLQQLPMPWLQPQRLAAETPSTGGSMIEFGDLNDDLQSVPHAETALDDEYLAPATAPGPAAEATLLMQQIDQHLTELTREYDMDVFLESSTAPAPGSANPFGEPFDQEEVLVDRYSSLEVGTLASHHRMVSEEGKALADLLETVVQYSAPQLTIANEAELVRVLAVAPDGGQTSHEVCHGPMNRVGSTVAEEGWFQATTADPGQPPAISGPISFSEVEYFEAGKPADCQTVDGDWCHPPAVPLVRGNRPATREDDDLMIVEDDPRTEMRLHPATPARHVRRQEFRQLFSSLRRG